MLSSTNVLGACPPQYKLVANPTTAYLNELVAKAAPGCLVMLKGYNSGGDQFVQIHDVAATPADGVKPIAFQKVFAQDNFYFVIPVSGMPFTTTGIYICNSSTGPSKTIGAADCWFEAYII